VILRLESEGRGRGYTPRRGAVESALRLLYRRDWPARLWGAVPWACDVECARSTLAILAPGHPGLRVGFVSDLHLGPTTPAGLLDAAFGHLAAAQLDVLLLGGDYVFLDATPAKARELASRVRGVPARRKLAVMGNHDLWTHHGLLERALEEAGVELLLNRSVVLDDTTCVVGLDEPWTGDLDAELAFASVGDARTLLVLCHSPEGLWAVRDAIDTMPPGRRVLYVCGHTHGGHIATPWGPVVVPGHVGKRYPQGNHRIGPIQLCVSRGVGGIELPVRTYARPQVHVFDLKNCPS
jgi:predicted MPP superfamily phosphohydrolase